MHRFWVWLTAIVAAVALVGLGLTVAPVSATIQVLCKGVSKAEVAKCNPAYANDMSKMHWRMYGGHNCTNYVAWQLGQNGVPEPKRLMGNARDWITNAKKEGYQVNSTPAVGSVGAWGSAKNHITYVVEVGSNYIVTHEDNYPGYYRKGLYQELKIYKGDSSYPPQFIHFKDLLSTGTPTISGTAAVGSPLSAAAGSWQPAGVAFRYQWLRDGAVISGATSQTYTPDASDLGTQLTVQVSGTRAGYAPASTTSAPTNVVVAGVVANTATPTISGTPKVGARLTVMTGTWAPSTVAFSYRWLRNGAVIAGATGSTYTPVAADAAAKISATVTASLAGFSSKSVTTGMTVEVASSSDFAAPENLRSTAQTDTALTLTWSAVPKAPKYRVQISTAANMSGSKYYAFEGTTGTIEGLKANTLYYFRIWVVDAPVKKRLSEISANAQFATRPAGESLMAPSAFRSTAQTLDALSLAWDPVAGAPKYQVQISTSPNMLDPTYQVFDGSTGLITGLSHDTVYYLRVRAVDAAGKTPMSPVSATVTAATKVPDETAFSSPLNLRSTAQGSSSLGFSWDAVAGAPKYRVQISTASTMKSSKYYAFDKTSGTITGLKAGTKYYFRIWVVDAPVKKRLSPISAVATGATKTISDGFAVPTGLRATQQTKSSLGFSWDAVAGAPKYRVQISTASTMKSSKYYAFDKTSGTITGLKAGTAYYFRIWVVDAPVKKRLSPISAVATGATRTTSGSFIVPTGLRATQQTKSSLGFSWDAVAGAPKYRVQISTASTMKSSKYYAFDKTSGTITGLKAGTKYYFRIWVVDAPVKTRLSGISKNASAVTSKN